MDESDSTVLVENNNHYYVVQVIETINVQKDLNDEITRKMIKTKVEEKFKRKIISEIIGKINNNKFNKPEFDKFAKNQKIEIKKIKINSSFDDKILNQKLVNQIYKSAGKRAIVIADIGLKESYLVYINKMVYISCIVLYITYYYAYIYDFICYIYIYIYLFYIFYYFFTT